MSDYSSLCIILIFTLGVVAIVFIVALTCIAIYLREVVPLNGKTKVDKKNQTLEAEITIDKDK